MAAAAPRAPANAAAEAPRRRSLPSRSLHRRELRHPTGAREEPRRATKPCRKKEQGKQNNSNDASRGALRVKKHRSDGARFTLSFFFPLSFPLCSIKKGRARWCAPLLSFLPPPPSSCRNRFLLSGRACLRSFCSLKIKKTQKKSLGRRAKVAFLGGVVVGRG